MNQSELRKQVKMLKALQNISYKEVSEYLEVRDSSMYNWLRGEYNLSAAKSRKLEDIIGILKE